MSVGSYEDASGWVSFGPHSLLSVDFVHLSVSSDSSSSHHDGSSVTLDEEDWRRGVFRAAKFALASGIGFVIAEAILVFGVVTFYHTTKVPSFSDSSPAILGLDALGLVVGVTAAFIVNESVTVGWRRLSKDREGWADWFGRLCKYQLASLLGNVIVVGVQLALLATVSLSPVFGSIVGAVVSFPITYVVSMHFVWRLPFRG